MRLLCPWHFTDKNAGVGCHFLLKQFDMFLIFISKAESAFEHMVVNIILEMPSWFRSALANPVAASHMGFFKSKVINIR